MQHSSGLYHESAGKHGKPGLTCHAMAVERALTQGDLTYDFLAGGARYKFSLSNASVPLFWAEAVHPWSMAGLIARGQKLAQRLGA